MKLIIYFIFICLILTSCQSDKIITPINEVQQSEIYSINYKSETEYIVESINENLHSETTTSVTSVFMNENVLHKNISLIKERYESNGYNYSYGIIYDFDFCGIPELLLYLGAMEWGYTFEIYKYSNNDWVFIGEMTGSGSDYSNALPYWIDLYFNPTTNEYFYISIFNYGHKNTGIDNLSSFIFSGTLNMYCFDDIELLQTELLNFVCNFDDHKSINEFFIRCNEILSQYEFIETIHLEPIWTAEDIKNNKFEEVIRKTFAEYGIYN